MQMVNLESRLIKSASYDDKAGSLSITMTDGASRRVEVPRTMFENLISAQSPGWYYTRHIRPLINA